MLRILIPMVMGIITAQYCDVLSWPVALACCAVVIFAALRWLIPHTPQWSLRTRHWWIVPIAMLSMAVGWSDAILSTPPLIKDLPTLKGNQAQARVDDIDFKDNSMSILATLTSVNGANGEQLIDRRHKILITTRGCDYCMQPGDIVDFACNLKPIRGLNNPDAFDYEKYMLEQGIRYSQHLPVDELNKCGAEQNLFTTCNRYRRDLQQKIFNTNTSADTQNFIIATLLGNSKFITPQTREAFSNAGIAHLLALSGLHVGIIMVMVWFFLFPLDYIEMRKTRLVLTIITVFLYAIFTGLSASVVRATIMSSIALIGIIFYRKSVSLNALATSAVILLAFDPESLYSAGFQLSVVTVACLLLMYKPQPNNARKSKQIGKIWHYYKTIIVTSLVAMVSTLMLTAWYFNSVTLLSVVANVILIPVFPIIMVLNSLFVFMAGAGIELEWYSNLIDWLYSLINNTVSLSNDNLGWHFGNIYVTGIDVLIYYMALALGFMWYHTKRMKWLNYSILLVTAIVWHNIYTRLTTPDSGLVFFNNYTQTQIFSFSNRNGYLWVPDGAGNVNEFKQYNRSFLAHYGIDSIIVDESKEIHTINNKKIMCITSKKDTQLPSQQQHVDYLIITKKCHDDIAKLCKVYSPKMIILSGNIYEGELEKITASCKKTGIPYHSIKENGALVEIE